MISAEEVRKIPTRAEEFFKKVVEDNLQGIENLIIEERKQGKDFVEVQLMGPMKGYKVYQKTLKGLISKGFKISNIRKHPCSFYSGYKIIKISW